jgi:hypothetical protein
MQTLTGIGGARALPHYVRSVREVILFVQAKTMQDGIMNQCEDYTKILDDYSKALREAFNPSLRIKVLDSATRMEGDEFSDHVILHVDVEDAQ